MTTRPDIAVLMPSYNPGDDLAPTLASLRKQTIPYHLFLVDDGSPRKPDYAVALAGLPHTLIELPKNAGITGALNAGLAEIYKHDFKYIARMDCGDEMTPDRLELQVAYLDAHPEIDIVGSWIEMVYTESNRRFVLAWPTEHEGITQRLWTNMSLSHPALTLRTSSLKALGNYSNEYDAAEDYELCRRAMKRNFKLHNIGKVLLLKTETRDSISWRKRRTQLMSRWRIQWAYRNLANPRCLMGLVKTGLVLAVPDGLAPRLKAIVGTK